MNKTHFEPMDIEELQEISSSLSCMDLVALTLTNTDIFLGSVAKHWEWGKHGEVVWLSFNMPEGHRFGKSLVIVVPVEKIADISAIPLSEKSIPRVGPDDPSVQFLQEFGQEFLDELDSRLPVQDYPNPLASIMYEHNMSIASAHGFEISYIVERALSKDAIPPEGISFDNDFLLYMDRDFFSTQAGTGITTGVSLLKSKIYFEKNIIQAQDKQALRLLKDSWISKIRRKFLVGKYKVLQGVLLVPEPAEDTDIEGEKCYLYVIASTQTQDDYEPLPVLVEADQLKFPREFLDRISSPLTFFGELLQIPVSVMGKKYCELLLARAIGYLHE